MKSSGRKDPEGLYHPRAEEILGFDAPTSGWEYRVQIVQEKGPDWVGWVVAATVLGAWQRGG